LTGYTACGSHGPFGAANNSENAPPALPLSPAGSTSTSLSGTTPASVCMSKLASQCGAKSPMASVARSAVEVIRNIPNVASHL
jgi:hypothetical protein